MSAKRKAKKMDAAAKNINPKIGHDHQENMANPPDKATTNLDHPALSPRIQLLLRQNDCLEHSGKFMSEKRKAKKMDVSEKHIHEDISQDNPSNMVQPGNEGPANLDHPALSPRIQFLLRQLAIGLWTAAVVMRVFFPASLGASGENSIIWLLAWTSLATTLLSAYLQPGWNWLSKQLFFALLTIILFIFATGLWASDTVLTYNQAWTWLSDVLLFIVLMYWLKEPGMYPQFFAVILANLTLELVYCIYQHYIGMPASRFAIAQNPTLLQELHIPQDMTQEFYIRLNISYWFGHLPLTNSLAGYLLLFLPLLLLTWNKATSFFSFIRQNIIHCIFLLITMIAFAMTGSRGGFLAFFIIITGYGFYKLTKRFPRAALGLAIVVLVVASSASAVMIYGHSLDIIGQESITFLMRTGYWTTTLQIWQENPVLGVGIANFQHHYYQYKPLWVEEVNSSHNSLLQWLAETGMLGLLLLVWLGYALWRFYCQNLRLGLLLPDVQHAALNSGMSVSTSSSRQEDSPFSASPSRMSPTCHTPVEQYTMAMFAACVLCYLAVLGQSFEWSSLESLLKDNFSKTLFSTSESLSMLYYIIIILAVMIWCFALHQWAKVKWSFHSLVTGLWLGWLAYALHSLLDIHAYVPGLTQQAWMILGFLLAAPVAMPRLSGMDSSPANADQAAKAVATSKPKSSEVSSAQVVENMAPASSLLIFNVPNRVRVLFILISFGFVFYTALYLVPLRVEIAYLQESVRRYNAKESPSPFDRVEQQVLLEQVKAFAPYDPELAAYSSLWQLNDIHSAVSQTDPSQIVPPVLMKHIMQAYQPLQQAIDKNPRHLWLINHQAQFFWEQARIFQKIGRPQETSHALLLAQKSMESALRLYPNRVKFLMFAGKIAEAQQDWKSAREYYKKALWAIPFDSPNPELQKDAEQAFMRVNAKIK